MHQDWWARYCGLISTLLIFSLFAKLNTPSRFQTRPAQFQHRPDYPAVARCSAWPPASVSARRPWSAWATPTKVSCVPCSGKGRMSSRCGLGFWFNRHPTCDLFIVCEKVTVYLQSHIEINELQHTIDCTALAMVKLANSWHCWVIGAIANLEDTTANCQIELVCNFECQSSAFNDEFAFTITLFKSLNTCSIHYSVVAGAWNKNSTHTHTCFIFVLQTETNRLCPQQNKNKHVVACPRLWTICLSTGVCASAALMPVRWRNVWRCTSALRKRFVPFVSSQCKKNLTNQW